MRKITIATMIYTDGTETLYGVYHCKLRGRKKQYVDFNDGYTRQVGTVRKTGPGWPDYLAMARQFETPEHPAFSWTKKNDFMPLTWG